MYYMYDADATRRRGRRVYCALEIDLDRVHCAVAYRGGGSLVWHGREISFCKLFVFFSIINCIHEAYTHSVQLFGFVFYIHIISSERCSVS